jgi:sulfur carrier protein
MRITVNGRETETEACTVAQLLQERGIQSNEGVAVAVCESVVRRRDHDTYALHEGDRVEIIRAVQGG